MGWDAWFTLAVVAALVVALSRDLLSPRGQSSSGR
jgi:hypothetical protein